MTSSLTQHHLKLGFIALLLCRIAVSETIFLKQFPVNPIMAVQVQIRLKRLQQFLINLSPQTDKQQLYLRVKLCEVYLQEMAKQSMKDYDNLMGGQKNTLDGAQNIVLGAKNDVSGKRNWVFSTNYKGHADRTLVLDEWKIELDKVQFIRQDPAEAISKW